VLWYRRDTYRIVTALKEGGTWRGLELVKKRKVSRTYVYLILSDIERRGYVQRLGDKPPYLYRWRQK
jgi:sugar-specific transcriptional regulator TrmB